MHDSSRSLAEWLHDQLLQRDMSGQAAAAGAGVGMATISNILNKGLIPRVETLVRLADFFAVPRNLILRLAAGLPAEAPAAAIDDDALIDELLAAFRRIPDEWKQQALLDVELYARLTPTPAGAERPDPVHVPRRVGRPPRRKNTALESD